MSASGCGFNESIADISLAELIYAVAGSYPDGLLYVQCSARNSAEFIRLRSRVMSISNCSIAFRASGSYATMWSTIGAERPSIR
jgi:hypothetical protein